MHPPIQTRCFKAYDIRGQVPADLNQDVAYRIGRALVAELSGKRYVVGRDMRLESPMLAQALIKGLTKADGGIMITASQFKASPATPSSRNACVQKTPCMAAR